MHYRCRLCGQTFLSEQQAQQGHQCPNKANQKINLASEDEKGPLLVRLDPFGPGLFSPEYECEDPY
jgi:hypothetical protein